MREEPATYVQEWLYRSWRWQAPLYVLAAVVVLLGIAGLIFALIMLWPAIEAEIELTWLDRVLYRYILIPFTRRSLLAQGQAFEWTSRHQRPAWGPGRIDPFNPVKFAMLGLPDDGTIGNSDMQAVWNLDQRNAVRADAPLHWDGLNNSIREVVLSSTLGDGTTAREYDARTRASLDRIDLYLRRTVAAPSPHRPDPSAAVRGRQVYLRLCGNCHEAGGAQTLTVVPVAEVGTDRHRVDMWTTAARDAYNGYRRGYDWGFHHFRKVEGYVSEPLDGLWLRAPYLHNGSVPTLADLLEPPERRPSAYLRGIEVLDAARGGFVAPACEPGAVAPGAFCYCQATAMAAMSTERICRPPKKPTFWPISSHCESRERPRTGARDSLGHNTSFAKRCMIIISSRQLTVNSLTSMSALAKPPPVAARSDFRLSYPRSVGAGGAELEWTTTSSSTPRATG